MVRQEVFVSQHGVLESGCSENLPPCLSYVTVTDCLYVFAKAPRPEGRQGTQLLVAGRDRAHGRRSTATYPLLSRGVERFRSRALAEDRGGLQRTRREHPTEVVSLRSRTAGRPKRCAGCGE